MLTFDRGSQNTQKRDPHHLAPRLRICDRAQNLKFHFGPPEKFRFGEYSTFD
jgi:hypothetical protein